MKNIITLIIACITLVNPSMAKFYKGAEYRTIESFMYGRFEVRMKSAEVSGMLASFFTYNDNKTDNLGQWNEIDIEILGRYDDMVQFNVITPGQINHAAEHVAFFNPHENFHVYAIEWTPDYVAWSVDGYEVYRQTDEHIQTLIYPQKLMMNIWPPNIADWAGTLDPADLPVFAYYDWIRYYKYTPESGAKFTLEWEDNLDEFDAFMWQAATHTFQDNNADFVTENVVFQDGYMILCLTTSTNRGYSGEPIIDEDTTPPYLVSAWAYGNSIELTFSEGLDMESALNTSNYITPGLTVASVELAESNKVILTVDGRNQDLTYNVIINNITDDSPNRNKMSLKSYVIKNYLPMPAKINLGGESAGEFQADKSWEFPQNYGYVGGSQTTISGTVSGTAYADVYKSAAEGLSFYNVRVPDGHYAVTFLLAESEYESVGSRVFNIYAEGEELFGGVDIYAQTGKNTAIEITAKSVEVSDGVLEIYFEDVEGSAVIQGIIIEEDNTTSVEDETMGEVYQYDLDVYPNPFNPRTNIVFSTISRQQVNIKVYNITGQLVATLADDIFSPGEHTVTWNAADKPSGVYFCSVTLGGKAFTRKMLLIK